MSEGSAIEAGSSRRRGAQACPELATGAVKPVVTASEPRRPGSLVAGAVRSGDALARRASRQAALRNGEILVRHHRLPTCDSRVGVGLDRRAARRPPCVLNGPPVDLPSMRVNPFGAAGFLLFTPRSALTAEGFAATRAAVGEPYRTLRQKRRANRDTVARAGTAAGVAARLMPSERRDHPGRRPPAGGAREASGEYPVKERPRQTRLPPGRRVDRRALTAGGCGRGAS